MNVKPGDLAIVVADPVLGMPDLGKIVEVLDARLSSTGLAMWWCYSETGFTSATGLHTQHCKVFDAHLRPVSGLPDTEDTTTDTPIKELA